MAKQTKATPLKVGDKVSIRGGFYATHWGFVERIDQDPGGARYHVSKGSIGSIAPVFTRRELKKESR